MPNILASRGIERHYPLEDFQDHSIQVYYFGDGQFPFQIKEMDDGRQAIFINKKPVLKNDNPAIPTLGRHVNDDGKKQYVYLTDPDNTLEPGEIDLFIPHYSGSKLAKHLRFARFLEEYNVPILENPETADIAAQKIKTYEVLSEQGISVPPAVPLYAKERESMAKKALDFFIANNRKVLLKSNISKQGLDIFIPTSPTDLIEKMNHLFDRGKDILLQKKINTGDECFHVRVAMCFGEVIVSHKFVAHEGEALSIIANARDIFEISLTSGQEETCRKVASTIGFNLGSIDCLVSSTGEFYVLEVNILPRVGYKQPQSKFMLEQVIKRYFSS